MSNVGDGFGEGSILDAADEFDGFTLDLHVAQQGMRDFHLVTVHDQVVGAQFSLFVELDQIDRFAARPTLERVFGKEDGGDLFFGYFPVFIREAGLENDQLLFGSALHGQ